MNRQAFLVTHSYFGSRRFEFTGRGQDLVSPFVVAVLLTLPTLGLGWVWYLAHKRRYFWDHTRFDTARFGCSVRGKALLALWAINPACARGHSRSGLAVGACSQHPVRLP